MTASSRCLFAAALLALLPAAFASAQPTQPTTKPALKINWSAKDVSGQTINVPSSAPAKPTILLFAMSGQDHSLEAIKQVQSLFAKRDDVQVLAVVSGEDAATKAQKLTQDAKWTWPIVADPGYEASGKMLIRAWPTTLVVSSSGEQVAHLGGCPPSYDKDLAAYVDFALGKIDEAGLKTRLETNRTAEETPQSRANLHLQLAEKYLEKGQVNDAREEINKALKLQPDEPSLKLALAQIQVLSGQPADAIKTVEAIDAKALPAWRIQSVRGRALVAQEKWDDAKTALTEALKLNPEPAETHYALGLVFSHAQDWSHAAEQFRAAFETTPTGRKTAAVKP